MRFIVRVTDFNSDRGAPTYGVARDYQRDGLSLAKAWRLANRAARRGIKMYGGTVRRSNWGIAAGQAFGSPYRTAVITVDRAGSPYA